MVGWIAINGEFFPEDEARISSNDRLLLFGDGITEAMLGCHGEPVDFSKHMRRLRQSASDCEIPLPWTDEVFLFELRSLMSRCESKFHSLRIAISRGISRNPHIHDRLETQRYLYCYANTFPEEPRDNFVSLKTYRSEYDAKDRGIKTNNYLSAIRTKIEAKRHGFDDIIWTNRSFELQESSFANLFLIGREGDLVEVATPPPQGILSGITRNRVIELLESAKIFVTERAIALDELARFDEGFLTSSVQGLVGIKRINEHRMYTERQSSIFRHIHRLYKTWMLSNYPHIPSEVDKSTGEFH